MQQLLLLLSHTGLGQSDPLEKGCFHQDDMVTRDKTHGEQITPQHSSGNEDAPRMTTNRLHTEQGCWQLVKAEGLSYSILVL